MAIQVSILDTGDLKRLARDLKQAADGRELRKEMTAEFRAVLRPIVGEVQSAYRTRPGYKGKRSRSRRAQSPLRDLLAKATRIEVRTAGKQAGVRIRVDGRRMPSGMRSLPIYAEGFEPGRWKARWRHPVFGNRNVWAEQRPFPTFYPTVEPHLDDARRAVDRVIDRVRRKLEAGR